MKHCSAAGMLGPTKLVRQMWEKHVCLVQSPTNVTPSWLIEIVSVKNENVDADMIISANHGQNGGTVIIFLGWDVMYLSLCSWMVQCFVLLYSYFFISLTTGSSSLSYNTPSHTDPSPRLAAKEGKDTLFESLILYILYMPSVHVCLSWCNCCISGERVEWFDCLRWKEEWKTRTQCLSSFGYTESGHTHTHTHTHTWEHRPLTQIQSTDCQRQSSAQVHPLCR